MDLLHNLKLGWYKSATLVHLFGTYIFFVLFIHIIQIVSKISVYYVTIFFYMPLYSGHSWNDLFLYHLSHSTHV